MTEFLFFFFFLSFVLSLCLFFCVWFVRLPLPDFTTAQKAPAAADSVTWKDFVTAFGGHDRAAEPKELKPFYDVLHLLGMNVSMRSRRAMAKFVSIGASLFDG